ncbi:A24 family peptidase [Syntrophobacter fumaroxidans]|uniref:Peptidase A24A, prepilin type IV n=1 Tax=Syntrophobacter fumaroxidans (strain DSM 10017 / MPOB) TaxID=335543 RepID=A0LIC8_SYNFM|nr:A24 family peptidase [Syntrophobacter fumaroxidans]ABK17180.1 peptidase A24A, prepilin type IV [Syntrophobacter fumaroxidans MPOB]
MAASLNGILGGLLCVVLIVVAVEDMRKHRIRNVYTFPMVAVGLSFHALSGGLEGLVFSLKGLGLGIVFLIFPYLLGIMGAGDVKLMGAVGSILGSRGVFAAFLLTCVAGGVLAVILMVLNSKHTMKRLSAAWAAARRLPAEGRASGVPPGGDLKRPGLAYGAAIATGTIAFMALEWLGYDVSHLLWS